eukprot:COSAG01_NODE_27694_length_679_cov_1.036207_1_plen_181_part_00
MFHWAVCTPRARRHRDSLSAPPGSSSTPPASSVSATRRSARCRRRCQPRGARRAWPSRHHLELASAVDRRVRCVRVRVERMGSQTCGIVGTSQPVLVMISPRTRRPNSNQARRGICPPVAGSVLTEIYLCHACSDRSRTMRARRRGLGLAAAGGARLLLQRRQLARHAGDAPRLGWAHTL